MASETDKISANELEHIGQLAEHGPTGALSPPADLWDGQWSEPIRQDRVTGERPPNPPAISSVRQIARTTAITDRIGTPLRQIF
jgi:hypothetical protein